MKVSKKLWIVTALALSALLIGCGESPIVSTTEVDSAVWSVAGVMYDAKTEAKLAQATVQYANEDAWTTITTDDSGRFVITGLTPGAHDFLFQADSFATRKIALSTTPDTSMLVWTDIAYNVPMYAMTGSLTGKAYVFEQESGQIGARAVAEDATVILVPGNSILGNHTATVDSDGEYTFADVPATSGTLMFTNMTVSGVDYSASNVSVDLSKQTVVEATDYVINGGFVVKVMSTNIGRGYFAQDSVEVTFSDSIVEGETMVSLSAGGTNAIVTTTWSSDGKTVVITPDYGLAANTTYTLSVVGRSGDMKSLSASMSLVTAPAPYLVYSNLWDANGNAVEGIGQMDTLLFVFSEDLDDTKDVGVYFDATYSSAEYETAIMSDTLMVIPLNAYCAGTTIDVGVEVITSGGSVVTTDTLEIIVVDGIEIISTNLQTSNGDPRVDVALAETLVVNFNIAVDVSVFTASKLAVDYVRLEINDGGTYPDVPFTVSWQNSDMTLVITPDEALLPQEIITPGYRLTIDGNLPSSLVNNTLGADAVYAFTTVFTVEVPSAIEGFALDASSIADGEYFNDNTDPNSSSAGEGNLDIVFTAHDSVDNYVILARGSDRIVEWYEVASIASSTVGAALYYATDVSLGAFDKFGDDNLTFGNEIQLIVVGENAAGRSTTASDTITISDGLAVGDTNAYGAGYVNLVTPVWSASMNNSLGATPLDVTLTLTFEEYMDVSGEPVVSITEAGGDPADAASDSDFSWEWISRTQGQFTVTVADGDDWSGDDIVVDITDLEDSSGNQSSSAYADDIYAGAGVTP